jgi:hypothetical protein
MELEEDPWNVQLVPVEPDPNDFDSFSDFEAAFKRWATTVSQLRFIAPNAKQLSDFIPIAVAEESSGRQSEDSALTLPPKPKKVGLVTVDFWDSSKSVKPLSMRDLVVPHVPFRQRLQKQHRSSSKKLGFSLSTSLSSSMDKILNKKQVLLQVYKLPNEPVVPKIHGSLRPRDLVGPRLDRNYRNDIRRTSVAVTGLLMMNASSIRY